MDGFDKGCRAENAGLIDTSNIYIVLLAIRMKSLQVFDKTGFSRLFYSRSASWCAFPYSVLAALRPSISF